MRGWKQSDSRHRIVVRQKLREMGAMIRQTECREMTWLGDPRAKWPDAPYEQLGLKDRLEQLMEGAAPTVRLIEAKLTPEAIDRADALLERVRKFPKSQATIVVGWACRIPMKDVAAHKDVRCSRRQAWYIFNGALDTLAREGWA